MKFYKYLKTQAARIHLPLNMSLAVMLVLGISYGLLQSEMWSNEPASLFAREETTKKIQGQILEKFNDVQTDDDAILGDPQAPVTIVEFSDYQCPMCSQAALQILPQIEKKYVEAGQVKIVFRDFPLNKHPDAFLAALAAECAGEQGDDKYYEMHDKLFINQKNLKAENLLQYAKDLNLDMVDFKTCFNRREQLDEVNLDVRDAKSLGITGTPTFFVNGWKVVGAQRPEFFAELIESELAQ